MNVLKIIGVVGLSIVIPTLFILVAVNIEEKMPIVLQIPIIG